MRVLPTRWRRIPAGIDMNRNYVTVTRLAYFLCEEDADHVTGDVSEASLVSSALVDVLSHQRRLLALQSSQPLCQSRPGGVAHYRLLHTTHIRHVSFMPQFKKKCGPHKHQICSGNMVQTCLKPATPSRSTKVRTHGWCHSVGNQMVEVTKT